MLRVGVTQPVERGVGIGTVACLVRACGRWDLLPLSGIGGLACKAARSGTEGGERAVTGRWLAARWRRHLPWETSRPRPQPRRWLVILPEAQARAVPRGRGDEERGRGGLGVMGGVYAMYHPTI